MKPLIRLAVMSGLLAAVAGCGAAKETGKSMSPTDAAAKRMEALEKDEGWQKLSPQDKEKVQKATEKGFIFRKDAKVP